MSSLSRDLTNKEREVLSLVLKGKSNKQIAGEIGATEQTVKNRLHKAFRKLRISSVRELLPIAEETKVFLHLVS